MSYVSLSFLLLLLICIARFCTVHVHDVIVTAGVVFTYIHIDFYLLRLFLFKSHADFHNKTIKLSTFNIDNFDNI